MQPPCGSTRPHLESTCLLYAISKEKTSRFAVSPVFYRFVRYRTEKPLDNSSAYASLLGTILHRNTCARFLTCIFRHIILDAGKKDARFEQGDPADARKRHGNHNK